MPSDNIKFKYNLQPYDQTGDTTGRRNLDFYGRNLVEPIKNHIGDRKRALDLGCGNGRINQLTHELFESIHCVDPIDELHDNFRYDNVTYDKKHIHELTEKYDVILMVGSMHSIWREYEGKTIEYLNSLIGDNGLLFVISDIHNEVNFDCDFLKVIDRLIFDDGKTSLTIHLRV